MKLDCEGEMILIEILIHPILEKTEMFIQERFDKVNTSKRNKTINNNSLYY